jgi:hypothetical protein
MTVAEFRHSLSAVTPPTDSSPELQALWYAANGDWNKAHGITQASSPALDWVHAYLHRVEGDSANAAYWYRRAGKPVATVSLDQEWANLVEAFCA